jgi:hypothetical protein
VFFGNRDFIITLNGDLVRVRYPNPPVSFGLATGPQATPRPRPNESGADDQVVPWGLRSQGQERRFVPREVPIPAHLPPGHPSAPASRTRDPRALPEAPRDEGDTTCVPVRLARLVGASSSTRRAVQDTARDQERHPVRTHSTATRPGRPPRHPVQERPVRAPERGNHRSDDVVPRPPSHVPATTTSYLVGRAAHPTGC